LNYFVTLSEPYAPTTTTLITVLWKALNPILYSEIRLDEGPDATRIGLDRGNLLGYAAGARREGGTLPGAVIVAPENDSPRTLMPPFGDVALAGIDEKVHLRLEAESESVAAGQEWVVGVALRNDATLPFNNLRFRILFDPTKLKVLDWHNGNWIREGTNIYDGFAHAEYPFEVHFANRADNERGVILYHVGTQEARFFPTGELARIRFEALQDASLDDVRFDFQIPRIAAESETDVQFLGASVFRDRKVEGKASQRPAPPPLKRPGT
jgi:hypothetical protein